MPPSKRKHRLEQHLDGLFGYAFGLCNNRDEAKDIVQECALKALSAANVPEDSAAYRAWLFKILRNHYFDSLRRRRTADQWAEDISSLPPRDMEYSGIDERLIDAITVRLEFGKLSAMHREILALVDISGFSYAEAAAHLDVPAGTIMSRISRARQALLAAIEDSGVRPLQAARKRQARD